MCVDDSSESSAPIKKSCDGDMLGLTEEGRMRPIGSPNK